MTKKINEMDRDEVIGRLMQLSAMVSKGEIVDEDEIHMEADSLLCRLLQLNGEEFAVECFDFCRKRIFLYA